LEIPVSTIHYAVLTSENRLLTLMLHHFAKYLRNHSQIKQVYEVLCAKKARTIWSKSVHALHRYRDFRVG